MFIPLSKTIDSQTSKHENITFKKVLQLTFPRMTFQVNDVC